MAKTPSSATSPTLLNRLRNDPTDQAAWNNFVDRYGPKLLGWCRRWGLQDADAEDVTQSVLLRLAEKMRSFAYDPSRSFRAWLKTLTQHAWYDFCESRKRAGQAGGDSTLADALQNLEARDDLLTRLDQEFDRELLDEAMARVRLRVDPAKWEVFRLLGFENRSGADVAQRTTMKVATMFVVSSKVQRMVQRELQKLEGDRDP